VTFDPQGTELALGVRLLRRVRGFFILRRIIGLALMAVMFGGIYFLVFRSGLLTPLFTELFPQLADRIAWVVADPKRTMISLAVLLIPHIGLYYALFENRR
jgi:hypothetical protein